MFLFKPLLMILLLNRAKHIRPGKYLLIFRLFLDKKAPTELEEANIRVSVKAVARKNRSRHSPGAETE